MSKFNTRDTRSSAHSPIATHTTPTGVTHEGAPGYARADTKSELFLLAVANMVGENTFYEKAGDRDERYENLIRDVAVADAGWTLEFLRWLRGEANMRSASLVGAAEAVKARLDAKQEGAGRQMIDAVLQRADEPGELLAYWTSRYGRAIPKPVKRGVGDAVRRLYTERALLKYDTASHGYRFADVIDLVHPTPDPERATWQGHLFRHALDRRHGHAETIPERLGVIRRNAWLRDPQTPAENWLNPNIVNGAGMTWEDALSLVGSKVDKGQLWAALIPSMGLMALARNLRNLDEAGVSDEVAAQVCARFADPEQVAKSRMFPFRWLSAYRRTPSLRWGHALDKALTASLANVPALPGRTLILVDLSGSMYATMSGKSDLQRADAARVFGAALALRAADATLVAFDGSSYQVPVPKGGSLLKLVESFPRCGGGTDTAGAVRRWYDRHDRVIIVTDEQAQYSGYGDVTAPVGPDKPVYTWNLAGYRLGHAPSGSRNRHTFGGLTDAAFRLIPLLESGRDGSWPWMP